MKILLSSVSTANIRRTYSHRNRGVPINAKHACILGHYLETFWWEINQSTNKWALFLSLKKNTPMLALLSLTLEYTAWHFSSPCSVLGDVTALWLDTKNLAVAYCISVCLRLWCEYVILALLTFNPMVCIGINETWDLAVSIKHFPLLMKPMHPISNAMLILVHTNQETFSADILAAFCSLLHWVPMHCCTLFGMWGHHS